MATYHELKAQLISVTQQAEAARLSEKKSVLDEVRSTVEAYGLTEKEVFGQHRLKREQLTVKYRDPETGATWSGRGRPPKWIAGKDRSSFVVKNE